MQKVPPVFKKIKKEILGEKYDLSVAFLSSAQMRKVTKETKGKNHASNVLAFPLSKTSGEILICPATAKPYSLTYLFIHGCLHLKGLRHGGTMERTEQRVLARVSSFTNAKNSNRNRHRHLSR